MTAESADRVLLGAAAAVWLALIGASVTAGVAITERATSSTPTGGVSTLLYAVIAVSAAVILGAVPMLLRARRAALSDDDGASPAPTRAESLTLAGPRGGGRELGLDERPVGGSAATGMVRPADTTRRESHLLAEPLWLRSSAAFGGAIGLALLAAAVATYLMATDNETAAWVCFGVAGALTVALAVLPPMYLRQFRALAEQLHGR